MLKNSHGFTGECSTLLGNQNAELMRALQFIVSALKSPELVVAAAEALDKLAENCGEQLAPEISSIISVAKPLVLDLRLEVRMIPF